MGRLGSSSLASVGGGTSSSFSPAEESLGEPSAVGVVEGGDVLEGVDVEGAGVPVLGGAFLSSAGGVLARGADFGVESDFSESARRNLGGPSSSSVFGLLTV
jgi:hypothetical protein